MGGRGEKNCEQSERKKICQKRNSHTRYPPGWGDQPHLEGVAKNRSDSPGLQMKKVNVYHNYIAFNACHISPCQNEIKAVRKCTACVSRIGVCFFDGARRHPKRLGQLRHDTAVTPPCYGSPELHEVLFPKYCSIPVIIYT